ncbi:paraquat-inducible protein A [Endozoicomonas arenosclerae]|uniref:paraquat-inducible protein A n=1 Tax=Endozoicomonas arenosclerae TaxID=1633495 RepID=UPI000785BDA8|nr:paraquat-inducible protein A [Endozoicomonas arenosclerae]
MTEPDSGNPAPVNSGADLGIKLCLDCHRLCTVEDSKCPRCGSHVRFRKKDSLSRCWALTLTAAFLYIPANLLPIMTVSRFDRGRPDTIMSGVIELIHQGMLPIALLVFTASILVPLLKLLGMTWLLICVHFGAMRPNRQTSLYRLIVWIGRWSMLDIFIISILVALVQFGQLGTVTAGPASFAFAAVVILTMWAAMSFDPRLLWDRRREKKSET